VAMKLRALRVQQHNRKTLKNQGTWEKGEGGPELTRRTEVESRGDAKNPTRGGKNY